MMFLNVVAWIMLVVGVFGLISRPLFVIKLRHKVEGSVVKKFFSSMIGPGVLISLAYLLFRG